MKKNIKKVSHVLLLVSVMLICILAASVSASAETNPWTMYLTGKTKTVYKIDCLKSGSYTWDNIIVDTYLDSSDENPILPTITCKSSNTKVATVQVNTHEHFSNAYFFVKDAGTTTITTKIKYAGKTNTYTTKLNVKKWTNPFKSIKIGSKSYTSKFKTNDLAYTGEVKGKLAITPASGWAVSSIKYQDRGVSLKDKTVKNNTNIDLTTGTTAGKLIVTMKNKKSGVKVVVTLKKFQIFG